MGLIKSCFRFSLWIIIISVLMFVYLHVTWQQHSLEIKKEERLDDLASLLSNQLAYPTSKNNSYEDSLDLNWLSQSDDKSEKPPERPKKGYNERSMEYCNPYQHISHGDEGTIDGMQLINVHIILRHGERSPIYSLPNNPSPVLHCLLKENNRTQKLKDFFSEGSTRIEYFPSHSICDAAELTSNGFLQLVSIGEYLKKIYLNKRNLLGKNVSIWHDQIMVRTTQYSRTHQTAWAFVYGFFSDNITAAQIPITFEKQGTNFCSSSLSGLPCNCAILQRLQSSVAKDHLTIAKNHSMYRNAKSIIASVLGVSVNHVPWVGAVLDVLMSYICQGKALPCIAKTKKCFTDQHIKYLWEACDSLNKAEMRSTAKVKHSDIMMHPLLKEIARRYINITKNIISTKLIVYSGHDKTVTPLTIALGINNGKWPPFASRLVFELYNSSGIFLIRVVYNGIDMTKQLPFCDKFVEGLCTLNSFIHFVFKKQLSKFGNSTYNDICKLKTI